MATTFRVRYKNHATPQEQHSSGDRYYLDSDVGRKMSGTADKTPDATGTLTKGVTISADFTDSTCNYNNDPTITMNDTSLLAVGYGVSGTGIPSGSTIASITNSTTFELSASKTDGSVTSGTLTFNKNTIGLNNDFIYIKNTDSTDLLVTLDGSNYLIVLSEGEVFASQISTSADVRIKTASGTTTADYYVTT